MKVLERICVTLLLTQAALGFVLIGVWSLGANIPNENVSYAMSAPPGPTGAIGSQGLIGPVGTQGIPGIQGIEGPKGDTGATGSQGEPGVEGPAGESGKPMQVVEQQANPSTGETEWRCSGDTQWTTLQSSPILEGSCL